MQLTFSTKYPAYHPKKGSETFFIEKIWSFLITIKKNYHPTEWDQFRDVHDFNHFSAKDFQPKLHTIREGHRFKVGDVFVPKFWSGRPYWSKPIQFAPPITVVQTYDFNKSLRTHRVNDKLINCLDLQLIAENDGLNYNDFKAWFNKDQFDGQIICFSEVDYLTDLNYIKP